MTSICSDCLFDQNIQERIQTAVAIGHLECLSQLCELELPKNCDHLLQILYSSFPCRDHIKCIEYLSDLPDSHIEFNEDLCAKAVLYDRYDLLVDLHEAGCPWNYKTTKIAIMLRNVKFLQYALDQNCECVWYGDLIIDLQREVAENKSFTVERAVECLQCLRDHGYPV